MGLNDDISINTYYNGTNNDAGDYQFTTMDNIINAFMIIYVGEDKILTKVNRTDVQFHAMRAIQELSYDVFRSIKSQEFRVTNTLKTMMPHDYVNYVKITRVGSDGIERLLYPASKTSNPFAVQQIGPDYIVTSPDGLFVGNDSGLTDAGFTNSSPTNTDANTLAPFASTTLNNFQQSDSSGDYSNDTTEPQMDNMGRRYGLDPQHAQANGTFILDNRTGFIHFGSSLAGEKVVLHYISDGLGTDSEMVVHKFCEEACYKWIAYGMLASRSNIPEYVVQRYKKEKFAETRKAKIRLSNIKIEEFTQVLKGLSKPIK